MNFQKRALISIINCCLGFPKVSVWWFQDSS